MHAFTCSTTRNCKLARLHFITGRASTSARAYTSFSVRKCRRARYRSLYTPLWWWVSGGCLAFVNVKHFCWRYEKVVYVLEEAHGCGEGKGGTVWLAFGLKLHRFAAHAAGPARPVLEFILPHCRASIHRRASLHFFKNEQV